MSAQQQAAAWWERLVDGAEASGPEGAAQVAAALVREADAATVAALVTAMTLAQVDAARLAQRLTSASN